MRQHAYSQGRGRRTYTHWGAPRVQDTKHQTSIPPSEMTSEHPHTHITINNPTHDPGARFSLRQHGSRHFLEVVGMHLLQINSTNNIQSTALNEQGNFSLFFLGQSLIIPTRSLGYPTHSYITAFNKSLSPPTWVCASTSVSRWKMFYFWTRQKLLDTCRYYTFATLGWETKDIIPISLWRLRVIITYWQLHFYTNSKVMNVTGEKQRKC